MPNRLVILVTNHEGDYYTIYEVGYDEKFPENKRRLGQVYEQDIERWLASYGFKKYQDHDKRHPITGYYRPDRVLPTVTIERALRFIHIGNLPLNPDSLVTVVQRFNSSLSRTAILDYMEVEYGWNENFTFNPVAPHIAYYCYHYRNGHEAPAGNIHITSDNPSEAAHELYARCASQQIVGVRVVRINDQIVDHLYIP